MGEQVDARGERAFVRGVGAIPGSVAVVVVRRREDGAFEVWRPEVLATDAPDATGAIPTADRRMGEDLFAAAARACSRVPLRAEARQSIELLGEVSRGPGMRPRALMRVVLTGEGDVGEGVWAGLDDPAFDDRERAWIRAATRR